MVSQPSMPAARSRRYIPSGWDGRTFLRVESPYGLPFGKNCSLTLQPRFNSAVAESGGTPSDLLQCPADHAPDARAPRDHEVPLARQDGALVGRCLPISSPRDPYPSRTRPIAVWPSSARPGDGARGRRRDALPGLPARPLPSRGSAYGPFPARSCRRPPIADLGAFHSQGGTCQAGRVVQGTGWSPAPHPALAARHSLAAEEAPDPC